MNHLSLLIIHQIKSYSFGVLLIKFLNLSLGIQPIDIFYLWKRLIISQLGLKTDMEQLQITLYLLSRLLWNLNLLITMIKSI